MRRASAGWRVCCKLGTHLESLNTLWHNCIVCCSQAELTVLIAPKRKQIAAVCHCKRVRVAAGNLHNVTAAEG